MPRRPLLVDAFNPVRKLIRMSWCPENTWALDTKAKYDDANARKTVFQQRWTAKREVRGYHVPNITQKQFIERHFDHNISLQHLSRRDRDRLPPVSALGMALLERRVDVIVFRIVEARRLVLQGRVKVNGEKSIVPCRSLIDGDCVTVDPNHVATLSGPLSQTRVFAYVPFMAPHLFTPEYLEVDYLTCSAVLLRSPLPQPSRIELPSPHPPLLHQLTHEWYAGIKRRKTKVRSYKGISVNGVGIRLKPKFASILKQDEEKFDLARRGLPYYSKKKVHVMRRKVVRFRYTPKRDRYALKYG